MSVVLITGSSGLVGSESVNFFCKKGFEVIGIDNFFRGLKTNLPKHNSFKFYKLDLLEPSGLKDILINGVLRTIERYQ